MIFSTYPRGFKGDEILAEAQVLAVADVVEAMSSHRPYRAALGIELALEEIAKHAGRKYNIEAAAACALLFNSKGFEFSDGRRAPRSANPA
jgi:putative two-component system response regulator